MPSEAWRGCHPRHGEGAIRGQLKAHRRAHQGGHQGGHQRSSSHLPSRRLHLDQGNQRSSGRPSEIIIPPAVSSPPPRSRQSEVIREAIRDHHPTCRLVASTSIKVIRGHQGGNQRSSSHLPSRRLHLDQRRPMRRLPRPHLRLSRLPYLETQSRGRDRQWLRRNETQ
mgnify:CR=1 FL=1